MSGAYTTFVYRWPAERTRLCETCVGVFPLDEFPMARLPLCRACVVESGRERSVRDAQKREEAKAAQPSECVDRLEIFSRDGGRCWWCERSLHSGWHLDHLVPIQSLGTKLDKRPGHVRSNVVASCPRCNIARGNRVDAWDDHRFLKKWYRRQIGVPREQLGR